MAVFPFGVATILGVIYYCGLVDWQKYFAPTFANRAIVTIVCVALLVLAFTVTHRARRKRIVRTVPKGVILAALFMMAIIPRVIHLLAIGQHVIPVSDYHLAYAHALGVEDHSLWYQSTSSWGFYALCLHVLFAFIPNSYVAIQCVNIIIESCIVVGIYQLAHSITKSDGISFVGATLYAINPTRIAYGMILTPEIPANLFFLLALILLSAALHCSNPKSSIGLFVSAGAMLGIGHAFKPIAPVIIIAVGVTLIFYKDSVGALIHARWPGIFNRASTILKRMLAIILVFLILIASCSGAKALCINGLEGWLDIEVHGDPAARFLFVGMRTDSEGQVHLGKDNRLSQEIFRDPSADYEEANALLTALLMQDLSENADKIPALLLKKIQWAWQDDAIAFYYTEAAGTSEALSTFAAFGQCAYLILMGFACFGAIALFLDKRFRTAGVFLIAVIIFGFALLLLISEAQSRYKVMVMPYVCILAAIGINALHLLIGSLPKTRAGMNRIIPTLIQTANEATEKQSIRLLHPFAHLQSLNRVLNVGVRVI